MSAFAVISIKSEVHAAGEINLSLTTGCMNNSGTITPYIEVNFNDIGHLYTFETTPVIQKNGTFPGRLTLRPLRFYSSPGGWPNQVDKNTTYSIKMLSTQGATSNVATITTPALCPHAAVTLNPAYVEHGGAVTVNWVTSDIPAGVTCTQTWDTFAPSITPNATGSRIFTNRTSPNTFTVNCSNGTTASATTQVGPPPAPVAATWSAWSACSATACGTSGTQTRTCTSEGLHGGRTCIQGPADGAGTSRACSAPVCANNKPLLGTGSITPNTVTGNVSTQHTITLNASDADGVNDIRNMLSLMNIVGTNAGQHRGYVGWTNTDFSQWWNNEYKTGTMDCTGGGKGAVFGGAAAEGYGKKYINLVSCATTTSGNSRTVTFVVTFTNEFTSPASNSVGGFVSDTKNEFDGWKEVSTFTLSNTQSCTSNATCPTGTTCQIETPPNACPDNEQACEAYLDSLPKICKPNPTPRGETPSPSPTTVQCTPGSFLDAVIVEGANCGTISTKPGSNATTGTITYTAPTVSQSEVICNIKVTTPDNGGCTVSIPKGTTSNPLSSGETITINYSNQCSIPNNADPALGSFTSPINGCNAPILISPGSDEQVPLEGFTYKIAETEAGLEGAEEKPYDGTQESFNATYVLQDQNPGLKQFWVEFHKLETGEKVRDFINVGLLSEDPELVGVNCSTSLGASNLVVDVYGRNLGTNTQGATITANGNQLVKTNWENEFIKATWASPNPAAVNGSQYEIEVTLADGRKLPKVNCGVGISMVSLGTRLFCRGDGSYALKGVKVLLIDEEGNKIEEMVDISHQGMINGIKTKFSEGKNYIISIKAANVVRRNITFKAQVGTTVVATENGQAVVLPLGDIAPRPDGDGAINGIDQSLLKGQWRVIGDATQPLTGDFNVDKRVNSFDWACMRHDWNARDDEIPARAPRSLPNGFEPTPSSSPRSCPTAPSCSAGNTLMIYPASQGGCASYECVPLTGCTSDAQCGTGNTCWRNAPYQGTCRPSNTTCTAATEYACVTEQVRCVTSPCLPVNTCAEFSSACHVPPGWTIQPRATSSPVASPTIAPTVAPTATPTAAPTAVPAATISVSPASVARGGIITVSWNYQSNTPTTRDVLETFNSAGVHSQNIYTSGCGASAGTTAAGATGSCPLATQNYGPGTYTIKLFRNGVFSGTPLATATYTVN